MIDSNNLEYQVSLYIAHANEMLQVAQANFEDSFYSSTINRAYYAIFYAASALLLTKGETRSKHGGVISTFRQIFIKPGLIEAEYSDIYGDIMESRMDSDYDMVYVADEDTVKESLADARRFVDRAMAYLEAEGISYE